MNIDFEVIATNTAKIHDSLTKAITSEATNPQILAELTAAADLAAKRLSILANGNKPTKAETSAS
jgi:hypothetical protein